MEAASSSKAPIDPVREGADQSSSSHTAISEDTPHQQSKSNPPAGPVEPTTTEGASEEPKPTAPVVEPSASTPNVPPSTEAAPATTQNPPSTFPPYQPYTFAYGSNPDASHYEQPVLFAGPHPDSNPYRDDDSAIGEYASTRSLTLNSSSFEFRQRYGRRYHAQSSNTEYHLPNGIFHTRRSFDLSLTIA